MIRIISGKPGKGKTLYAIYLMMLSSAVNGYKRYLKSCKEIQYLNSCGYNFSYPQQKHVTYFNGQARISMSGRPVKNIYTFNPWKLALPTRTNDVQLFFPYSDLFIDEAQRFYNSRLYQKFPQCVSRLYELHRQWGLTITLICQRPGLIDLNIRQLAEELIWIEDVELIEGSSGNLLKATWKLRKFTSNADLERYLDGHKELGEIETVECTENLYKFYDTFFFKFLFLNRRKNQDFLQKCLQPFKYSPKIVDALSDVYSAEAPPEYYELDSLNKKYASGGI